MRKPFILVLVAAICFLAMAPNPAAAGEPNMREGKWEISTRMEMPGMPEGMAGQTFTHTQCLTKEDLVPRDKKMSEQCEMRDVHTSGDTITWTLHCQTEQGEMVGNGEITYERESFEGWMIMNMPGMKMTQHMKGRRIGPCE